MELELTQQERDLILKQREADKIRGAGGYGSAPRLGQQETNLLAQMEALNVNRLTLNYGNLPRDIDAATLDAVKRCEVWRIDDGTVLRHELGHCNGWPARKKWRRAA
jgi:hypothetical protein